MNVIKGDSQQVHTIVLTLTDSEFNRLMIDYRTLSANPGLPVLRELIGHIERSVQPKPTHRDRTGS